MAPARSLRLVGLDIAMLDDLQCGEQLRLGKGRATAFVGQSRQERITELLPLELAEVAFHAPDRDQRLAVDAIPLLDALQDIGMLISIDWPLRTRTGDRAPSRVFPHRAGKLRLAASGADHRHVGVAPANALSKTAGVIPAFKACSRKPACHSAKVWVGWMSRLSTASGAATAGAATGAVCNVGRS